MIKNINIKNITKIVIFYSFGLILEIFARQYNFLWSIYLPVATAGNVLLFDELVQFIDFEDIKHLDQNGKNFYILALTVLSAGFAIATAIFLK